MTTLPTNKLNAIIDAVRQAGEDDANDALYEQLHDTATTRAGGILLEHCPDIENIRELDPGQHEQIVIAYKEGFWELCHQRERHALKAALQRICDYPANGNSDPDVMADALDDIHRIASEALNWPDSACRRGWRAFECQTCGHKWEWPSRDRFSPSGENCPECGEWEMPRSSRADPALPVDDMGNLTVPWNMLPTAANDPGQ